MSEPRPWKRLFSQREADYGILRIRQDVFQSPKAGQTHTHVMLEMADWVNVIALTLSDELVMVRQFRTGTSASSLELPGGILEPSESAEAAAARELEEETGFRAAAWVPLGFAHPNPALQGNRAYTFLATGCVRAHDGHPDEGEDLRVELVPRTRLQALIREGVLNHSVILGGILLGVASGHLELS